MERQISVRPVKVEHLQSWGDPEYSGLNEPKRTFPFDFWPKFPESLAYRNDSI